LGKSLDRASDSSELLEIKVIFGNAQIVNDVGDDSARHVSGMPGKSDEKVRLKRIGVMPMTASGSEEVATDCFQAALELAAIP